MRNVKFRIYPGVGGATPSWEHAPLFELDSDEYNELVTELTTNPDYEIAEDEELKGKRNFREWHGALLSKYARKRPDA